MGTLSSGTKCITPWMAQTRTAVARNITVSILLDEEGDFTLKYIAYNEKGISSEVGKEDLRPDL